MKAKCEAGVNVGNGETGEVERIPLPMRVWAAPFRVYQTQPPSHRQRDAFQGHSDDHVRRRMTSLPVTIFLLSFLLTTASGQLPKDETAGLLKRLRDFHARYPAFVADFTETRTTRLLTKPLTTEGTTSFQSPDKFRRVLRGANPSVTVSNGKQLWIYYPNFKEAEVYALGERAFFDDSLAALTAGLNFQNVDEFYNFKAFAEGDGYRLQLVPKRTAVKRIVQELLVTMDRELTIEKTEILFPKGDRLVTHYRNLRRTSIPPATFEFAPPPDVHVSRPLGK